MLYPIYVHKDEESAFRRRQRPLPEPTAPEAWKSDPDFQGGYWMLVDIDLTKVRSRAVRLNISLPENLVQRIDSAARSRGQSRSPFLASAAEREMAQV